MSGEYMESFLPDSPDAPHRAMRLVAALVLCAAAAFAQGKWERRPALEEGSFASNAITALAFDEQGALWAGTDRGLVYTVNSGRSWEVINLAQAAPIYGSVPFGRTRERAAAAATSVLSPEAARRRNSITCLAVGRKGVWAGTLNGLCLSEANDATRSTWYVFTPESGAPGPEIYAVAEYRGAIWVSARGGVWRSTTWGKRWERVDGAPVNAGVIFLGRREADLVAWIGGYDVSPHAGAPDLLRRSSSGETWEALRTRTAPPNSPVPARVNQIFAMGPTLWAGTRHGLARSRDDGRSWRSVPHRSGLTAEEVFDVTNVGANLWAATNEGVFVSEDGGERWRQEDPLRCPVRRIAAREGVLWLATDGGLVRRSRGGDWKVFGVPAHVLSLAWTERAGRQTLWVGAPGALSTSRDNGKTWRSFTVADGVGGTRVLSIATDGARIWAGTDGGIWSAGEGGEDPQRWDRRHGLRGLRIYDMAATAQEVWAATDRGLSVLKRNATTWRTLLPSREWRCIALKDERLFAGVVEPSGGMSLVIVNPQDESVRPCVLPGLRGGAIRRILALGDTLWVATDAGLYRSRDLGETWGRFGAETLWAARITCMAAGPDNELCIQAVPNDPPAPVGFLNISRDNGRTWTVLTSATPGHANAVLIGRDQIVAGTRDGLSVFDNYAPELRPGRQGWLPWNRIAALAASATRPDRMGWVSEMDPYAVHGTSLWWGSDGAGAIQRGLPLLDILGAAWDLTGSEPLDVSPFSVLPGERVHALAIAPSGVWFGTGSGLTFFDRLDLTRSYAPSPDGLCGAPVRALAVRGEEIWAGADQGVSVLNTATGAWRTFRAADSPLPDDHVAALACDGENIWGGTARGAFRVDPANTWTTVLPEERVFDLTIGSVRQYFATDRGVFALDREGRVRRQLTSRNCEALSDDTVFRVLASGPDLWAATKDEIRKILVDSAEPEPPLRGDRSSRAADGVLVIVNTQSPDSLRVGEGYAALRGIPPENICRIACPVSETVSRGDYENQIRRPVWKHLMEQGISRRVSFLVATHGVPLRILAERPGDMGRAGARDEASVDSELCLAAFAHPLGGWLLNPYLHREEPFDSNRFGMYLVTRLDGPNGEAALGLAQRAAAVEEARTFGARGFVRFDLYPDGSELAQRFDDAILANFRQARRQGLLSGRVVNPERSTQSYFRPGECVNTLFFLGWGIREYRPEVFSWVQGAVAVTLDGGGAKTLRDPRGAWLAGAIDGEITAGMGMTDAAGPDPWFSVAGVYRYLMAGFTWAEAAYMCLPQLSWQGVVVGDPLYTPFK